MSDVQSSILDHDLHVPAALSLFVDLKAGSRGIHMSRLYLIHTENILNQGLTTEKISDVLNKFIQSQDGLSSAAKIKINYQSLIKTESLKSEMAGFRSYPVEIESWADASGLKMITTKLVIMYSSTCPQSTKLSKEFFKNKFDTHEKLIQWYESNENYPATPHAQRSHMTVEIQTLNQEINIKSWILKIESALKTTVQTSVKKADELEFARLNAENAMFCEDAVRFVANALNAEDLIGYRLTAEHFESLHSHNAYSQIVKSFNCN
jgi:GTP cyclohydrolase IB